MATLPAAGLANTRPADCPEPFHRVHGKGYAVVALAAAAYLLPFVCFLTRVGDEGTIVYGAQRVAEGAVPFRDFFEVMGPGCFYWLGLWFRLLGVSFLVARLQLWLTGVVSVMLVYYLATKLVKNRLAYIPPLFVCAAGIPLWPATSHHWDSNLFFLIGASLYVHAVQRRSTILLVLAGAAGGVTAFFMANKGFLLVAAMVVASALGRGYGAGVRDRVRALTCIVAGSVAVLGAAACWFVHYHALHSLIYANITWPLENYGSVNSVPYNYLFVPAALGPWKSLLGLVPGGPLLGAGILLSSCLLIIPLLPIAGAVCLLVGVSKQQWREPLMDAVPLAVGLAAWALWLSEIHRRDFFHLNFGAPLLLVYTCYLVGQLREKRQRKGALVVITILLAFAAGNLFVAGWKLWSGITVQTRRGPVIMRVADPALEFLVRDLPPRETVFIYPYCPMYYFLADLRNPTEFSILMYGYNTRDQFRQATESLESAKVNWVMLDTVVAGEALTMWSPNYHQPSPGELIMEPYLAAHYQTVGARNGFKILRRKPI